MTPSVAETGRLLVVEDDDGLRASIVWALRSAGHHVGTAVNGIEAGERIADGWDIVLLDLGLPFVNGWRILETLEGRLIPSVIVISARGEERDKVRALDLGADDYLTKPFGADELLARTRAVLRRMRATSWPSLIVEKDGVRIDLRARAVSRDGAEVHLSPTEFTLLAELAANAGHVMDSRTLLSRVWGATYVGDRNYLRTFIQRLRRKLEDDPAEPTLVVTVGRRGYRFGPMVGAEGDPPTRR